MRVLIVDDDPDMLALLTQHVVAAGYDVTTATDVDRAMAAIRAGDVRMVISDWDMPGATGLDLCRMTREADLPGYVYFVIVTANSAPDAAVRGLEAGADDFLNKPVRPAELIARLRAGQRVLSMETRDVAIFAMAKLAESRDPETGAHLDRVRVYCRILAEHLATTPKYRDYIRPEYIRLIYLTSPLHDIGKIAIPDSVLLKPGQLTDREFAIMKTHTTRGAETLDAAVKAHAGADFLRLARDIAKSHHERWDGSGYPEGLVGEEIPLSARIMAVADVYDALVSKRVYKEAFAHDVAASLIRQGCGSDFDPDVVDAFIVNEERFAEIRRHFYDDRKHAA